MYEEGDIADGPNGQQLIYRSGQWVPLGVATPAAIPLSGADPDLPIKRAKDQLELQKLMRDAANSGTAQTGADLENEAKRLANERSRRDLATGPQGKPLRQGDGDKIEADTGTYESYRRALSTFNDDFAGSLGSSLENAGQRVFGTGTPGQAQWWADFSRTDNIIRNGLFGASLTDGEKAAYAATTVSPSMQPSLIRENLSQRAEILRKAMTRKIARLKAAGFSGAEIDAATGEFGTDFTRDYKPQAQPETTDKTTRFYMDAADSRGNGVGPNEISAPTGPTITETDPALAGVNARVNGMLKSGASDDQIKTYLSNAGVNPGATTLDRALDFRRKNPGYRGNYEVAVDTRQVPQSGARQAFQAIGSGPLGSYATSAADALTAGRLDNIAGAVGGNQEQVNAAKELLAKTNPYASLAGQISGGALAAAGTEIGLARSGLTAAGGIAGKLARSPYAADVAYGAAYGSDEAGPGGAVLGGILGRVGGGVGNRAVKAIGGLRDEGIQTLRASGIPLTVGQALSRSGRTGAILKSVEDGITGIPGIGALAQARRYESLVGANKAAFAEAAGEPVKEIGERGAELLDDAVTRAYAPLDNVRVQIDPALGGDLAVAAQRGQRIPGRADDFNYIVNERVAPNFAPDGSLTGRNYQDSVRGLRSAASEQPDSAMHRNDFSQALGDVGGALTGLLERQAPSAIPVLNRANDIFRKQAVIDAAVKAARNQRADGDAVFTMAQLNTAATQNTANYGGRNAASTTRKPFYDLTNVGQEVLPSKIADSGTGTRLALTAGLTGAGAGAGYVGDNTTGGAAAGLAVAGLQTKLAQQLIVKALLDRAPRTRAFSDRLEQLGVGRAIGAPLALQALPAR